MVFYLAQFHALYLCQVVVIFSVLMGTDCASGCDIGACDDI